MRRNWTTAPAPSGRTKRISWLVSFVIPMVLLALLLAVKPAGAAMLTLGQGGRPLASAAVLEIAEPDEEEAGEGGTPSEECAEAGPEGEEAGEETEVEEAEETEPDEEEAEPEAEEEKAEGCSKEHRRAPPAECLLRTARARLFAYTSHDRVRLVIRYTTFAPASVAVDFSFNGGKRPQRLGAATERFAASGLFRVTEKLSRKEMAKVLTAKGFTVTMDIAAAPAYCHRFYTRHLTVRRNVHGQTVWYQSGSAFGTPRLGA